jgi:hypothetical protein
MVIDTQTGILYDEQQTKSGVPGHIEGKLKRGNLKTGEGQTMKTTEVAA